MIWNTLSLLAVGLSTTDAVRFSFELEARSHTNKALAARQAGLTGDTFIESFDNDLHFATSVLVGNSQNVTLLVDTGSSDLWFLSTLVSQNVMQEFSTNNFFDPNASSTFQYIPGAMFNESYDVGEIGASGPVGEDIVTVGGIQFTGMPFGLASSVLGPVINPTFDGLLGLGFPIQNSITVNGQRDPGPTFMTAVLPYLDEPVFTADFQEGHPKSLAFGYVDSSLYTGNLSTIPVDGSRGYWTLQNIVFSSGSTALGSSSGIPMIMDTGGASTSLDSQSTADYWALVQGSQYDSAHNKFYFPCNTPSLPDLTFNFPNGAIATIPGAALNISAHASGNNDGMCSGGLQPTGTGVANSGAAFFHTYFTVWNQAQALLSFAPYSNVDDTDDTNYGNLPDNSNLASAVDPSLPPPVATIPASASTSLAVTATAHAVTTVIGSHTGSGSGATSTSSHHNAAATKAPIFGIGAGAALMAGLVLL